MAPQPSNGNGIAARVEILERQQAATFERLRTVDRLDERMASMQSELRAMRREAAQRDAQSVEHREMTSRERVGAWTAGAMVLAAIITTAGVLIQAGVL